MGFLGPMLMPIIKSKNILISDISSNITHTHTHTNTIILIKILNVA